MKLTYAKMSNLCSFVSVILSSVLILSMSILGQTLAATLLLISGAFAIGSVGFIFVQGKYQLGDIFGLIVIVLGSLTGQKIPCITLTVLGIIFVVLQLIEFEANQAQKDNPPPKED